MGETRWGRPFFWLASVAGAVVAAVLLLLLLMPIAIPLVVPILFAGLGGLMVLIALLAIKPTQRPEARRVSTRWLVVALAILGALDVAALLISTRRDDAPGPGWVRAGSVSDLEREHVVYLSDPKVFVVDGPSGPLALSAFDPHLGERILFCRSSGWFEEPAHGSKYDGLGYYALGPSPRGMDRVGVRVVDGAVWVDVVLVTMGPPRGAEKPEAPLGPFCDSGEGDVPGFAS